MQEQVPSNISADQGWSQMKAILDREMPVARQPRRLLFLWRTLVAGLLLTTTGYLMWSASQEAKHNRDTRTEQPVQQQPLQPVSPGSAHQDFTHADQQEQEITSHSQSSNSQSSSSTITDQSLKPTGISDKNATVNQQRVVNKKISNQATDIPRAYNVLPQADPASSSSIKESFETQPAAQSSASVAQATADESTQESVVEHVADANTTRIRIEPYVTTTVPVLGIEPLYFERVIEMDIAAAIPIEPIEPRHNKPALDAYVSSAALVGFQEGAAWQAGAGVSLAVIPKTRFTAGLSYRTYSPDFSLASIEADEALGSGIGSIVEVDTLNFDIPYYVHDYSLNAGTAYQAVQPLVKSIRQWQIDAGMSYDLSKRFFLQAGISYAIHTTAYSAYPIIGSQSADPYAVRINHELEDYDVVRKDMISLSAGIGYHIGHNLDVYAQAVHGLNSYLQSDPSNSPAAAVDRTDYIRGISLGVKYRLL